MLPPQAAAQGKDDDHPRDVAGVTRECTSLTRVPEDFVLLCIALYRILNEHVDLDLHLDRDAPSDLVAQLAAAAAQGVRDASLEPRTSGTAPMCFEPIAASEAIRAAFETMCDEIDQVLDTAAAVVAATDAMLAFFGDPETAWLPEPEYQRYLTRVGYFAFGVPPPLRSVPWAATTASPFAGELSVGLGFEYEAAHEDGTPCTDVYAAVCWWVVTSVEEGGAADMAGLQAGDVIRAVLTNAGTHAEQSYLLSESSCTPWSHLDEQYITDIAVRLEVQREAGRLTFDLEGVEYLRPGALGFYVDVSEIDRRVGFIQVHSMGDPALSGDVRRFRELLNRLITLREIDLLYIDLRGTHGNNFDALESMAGMLLGPGVDLGSTRLRAAITSNFDFDLNSVGEQLAGDADDLPVVVLVDERTEGSSEWLAHVLQHYDRALVAGIETAGLFGMSLTRTVHADDGSSLGGLRLTAGKYTGPDGMTPSGGVVPDREFVSDGCPSPTEFVEELTETFRPSITRVEITSRPEFVSYRTGEVITVTVTIDDIVSVDTAGGVPYLGLQVGPNLRQAAHATTTHADGRTLLTFDYTVVDEWDDDGVSLPADPITLNGGTIRAGGPFHFDAMLSYRALDDDPLHTVRGSSTANMPPQLIPDEVFEVSEHAIVGTDVGRPIVALDLDPVTFGLESESEEVLLAIDVSSGQLRTSALLDHESLPVIPVTVVATDSLGAQSRLDIVVTVVDENDDGEFWLSSTMPRVSVPLTAELFDQDDDVVVSSWAWERSQDGDVWEAVDGEAESDEPLESRYVPGGADLGHFLRATVVYEDEFGGPYTLSAVSAGVVGAPPADGAVVPVGDVVTGEAILIMANGWRPPDIAAAAALSAHTEGSAVFYTAGDRLSEAARDLLADYRPAEVVTVGGTAAVSLTAFATARRVSDGSDFSRIGGATRVETAAGIARRILGAPGAGSAGATLFVANGWRSPDISVAAALSAQEERSAILYTAADGSLAGATAELIAEYRPARVVVVGGVAVVDVGIEEEIAELVPDAGVERVAGADRTGTAAGAVRESLGLPGSRPAGSQVFMLANGWRPPDVMMAAVLSARTPDSYVLFAPQADRSELTDETVSVLGNYPPSRIVLVGGSEVISERMRDNVRIAAPDARISRLSGPTRVETAAAVARRILGTP